jgi:hypothetical protein
VNAPAKAEEAAASVLLSAAPIFFYCSRFSIIFGVKKKNNKQM